MVHIIRVMKKTAALLAALALCLSVRGAASAASAPSVSAKSAVVLSGGCAVYEKNADMKLPIASTTKLMTAILALENCRGDECVYIRPEYCNVEGSSMYLTPGERRTVKELVTGLLLVSGNDAALALAGHIAGDSARFAALMNAKAEALGMADTHFVNPHGLNASGHYSTARDMARLMEYCMDNAAFAELDGMTSCTVDGKLLVNHNRLLGTCPGCIGGKTGFTEAAGRCLVSCCVRDGARLVCVTLSAPDDWNDHIALYTWAYSRCAMRSVTGGLSFCVPVISGERRWAYLVPEKELALFLPMDAEIVLRAELPWFEFAPVTAGEAKGRVTASVNGVQLAEYDLVYKESVGPAARD